MNEAAQALWSAYYASLPERQLPAVPENVFAFGDSPEMANELGALVARGIKTATTSALWAYAEGEPIPQIGSFSVVLDGHEQPLCVSETIEVETKRFSEVDERFAYDEGEGDRSLVYWRDEHVRFFNRTLPAIGKTFSNDIPVICERFGVVYLPQGV